jgi:hypothetical protein
MIGNVPCQISSLLIDVDEILWGVSLDKGIDGFSLKEVNKRWTRTERKRISKILVPVFLYPLENRKHRQAADKREIVRVPPLDELKKFPKKIRNSGRSHTFLSSLTNNRSVIG